jgi:hypothetical protein
MGYLPRDRTKDLQLKAAADLLHGIKVVASIKPKETSVAPATAETLPVGQREQKFTLTEGDVIVRFPQRLSVESVADLEAYLGVFLKKAQGRRHSDVVSRTRQRHVMCHYGSV